MKILLSLTMIVGAFIYSLSLDSYDNYKMTKLDSLIYINSYIESHKFKYSGKFQDAGDFDHKLDTAIIRKVKLIKFESDKYK